MKTLTLTCTNDSTFAELRVGDEMGVWAKFPQFDTVFPFEGSDGSCWSYITLISKFKLVDGTPITVEMLEELIPKSATLCDLGDDL